MRNNKQIQVSLNEKVREITLADSKAIDILLKSDQMRVKSEEKCIKLNQKEQPLDKNRELASKAT
jgi:hypothetical protein